MENLTFLSKFLPNEHCIENWVWKGGYRIETKRIEIVQHWVDVTLETLILAVKNFHTFEFIR